MGWQAHFIAEHAQQIKWIPVHEIRQISQLHILRIILLNVGTEAFNFMPFTRDGSGLWMGIAMTNDQASQRYKLESLLLKR